ncbi:hypothetical protein ScalyP_jg4461 [Parmales sp. scaly parma]|nr:hypothetical protein ScalyP_jg4461 [Parmales sp. scaly parma]|tara:strand:+ start:51 stop:503 length:453 start_codon:yes stop_codon:yes gene_type:complete
MTSLASPICNEYTLASSTYQYTKDCFEAAKQLKGINRFVGFSESAANYALAKQHQYTKSDIKSLSTLDVALTPALVKFDADATPTIQITLKTSEKIATPLTPYVKFFAKFFPVKTAEKVSSLFLSLLLKNMEAMSAKLKIDEVPESSFAN